MNIRDAAAQIASSSDRSWREEMLASNTAELERLRAEHTAAIERFASSDVTLDFGSVIHEGLRAIAGITADDVVRYARRVLGDPGTRDASELLLTLGAIWLWGVERSRPSEMESRTRVEPPSEVDLQLNTASVAFYRWFASLSAPVPASLLWLLAASPAEIEALGIWSPPGTTDVHLDFIMALVVFSSAVAARRRG